MGTLMRIVDALRFESGPYLAVRSNPGLIIEAVMLVLAVGAVTALPSAVLGHATGGAVALSQSLLAGALRALLVWLTVGTAAFAMARFFYRTRASWRATVSALAYTATPLLLPVALGFSPALVAIAYFVALSWVAALMFVALRDVLNVEVANSIYTTIAALVVLIGTWGLMMLTFGSPAVDSGVLWGPAIQPLCPSGVVSPDGECLPADALTPVRLR